MLQASDALNGGEGWHADLDSMAGSELLKDSERESDSSGYLGTRWARFAFWFLHPRRDLRDCATCFRG